MTPFRCLRFSVLLLLAGGLPAGVTSLSAAEGGFAATLSAEQQAAAGLATLSPVEQLTLDQLVAWELASVRRGTVEELSGTFISRRSDAERKAAGLDRLTDGQIEKLNEFVAAALAAHPRPKERPRLKEADVLADRKGEVHGSVTLGYGWGGGRTVRSESLWLDYYDPESHIGIGVGLSNFDGNGFFGYGPDYSAGGRYYGAGPAYYDASFRGDGPRGDFSFGEGQSFRGCGGGGFGRGRGH